FACWNPCRCLAGLANFKHRIHLTRAARSRRSQFKRWLKQTTYAVQFSDYAGRARDCSARRRRIDIEKLLARTERAARFRAAWYRQFRNFVDERQVQNKRAEGRVLAPTVATRAKHSRCRGGGRQF